LPQLNDLSISEYITSLASSAATPGGGAAAGLTAAQAAALLEMVCNLTNRDTFPTVADQISVTNHACKSIREDLLDLTARDAQAFDQLMACYQLPRSTQEEVDSRTARLQQALRAAAGVPLEVMRETVKLAIHAALLVEIGNPNLITDVGVAIHLMEAALSSARLNVLINARLITDSDFAVGCKSETIEILKRFTAQKNGCLAPVEEKLHT
jgi:formiminotetrahydrofolate cyclodeaminase|tara:strand:+ start:343 stop:975 length:633 start_codon:yes stop_codon:yes gene_type:complete